MTVSTTTNKISYTGNGIATMFAVPFPFLNTSHLKVRQLLNDVQTERTDWTVQSGNIVFASAPVSGAQIVILREVPLTQETDYRENEILPAETLERNLDALTMQVQQLKEKTDRAVTVDVFDDTQASELLPSIRTAVSTAAGYASTATTQAASAAGSADTATAQATLATAKAAEATATLAGKANVDLSNCTRPYVTDSYSEGGSWYRIWSDGKKECGGIKELNAAENGGSFTFPLVFTQIPMVLTGIVSKSVETTIFTYNNAPTVSSVFVGVAACLSSGCLNAPTANGCHISVYAQGY